MTLLLLFALPIIASAQKDTPCECAQRWTGGGSWNANGTVNDAPNAPAPNGIIRCGSAAETQSNIVPTGCKYDPAQFKIDLTGKVCLNPNTKQPVTVQEPVKGCDIIWLNFDVRAYAGSYEYQIVSNNNVGWALYYSNSHTDSVGLDSKLSGDCSKLVLAACGDNFNNTFANLTVPSFSEPTNLFLAIWDQNCSSVKGISVNFKARYGCGDSESVKCSLDFGKTSTICNDNGTYTLHIPITGVNGYYRATDPNALNSPSAPVCLKNLAAGGPTTGTLSLTYPAGAHYNVTVAETGDGVSAGCYNQKPINPDSCRLSLTGTAPNCCKLDITCPASNGGTYSCTSAIPAPNAAAVIVNSSCGKASVQIKESQNTGTGCAGSPLVITRTYTVTDEAGNIKTCTQTFTVVDNTGPVLSNVPANVTIECDQALPTTVPGAADACGGIIVVNYSDKETLGECENEKVIVRTFKATDACGNTSTAEQKITVRDTKPPVLALKQNFYDYLASAGYTIVGDCKEVAPGQIDCGAIYIECGVQGLPDIVPANALQYISASDNCDKSVWVNFQDFESLTSCPELQRFACVYTAKDNCGNTATLTFHVVKRDSKPPVLTCPSKLSLQCTGTNNEQAITNWLNGVKAEDACSKVTISHDYSGGLPGGCNGSKIVTFKATDVCGNFSTCTAVIELKDNTPPTIADLPDVTVECNQPLPTNQPAASDNCSTVEVSKSDKEEAGACLQSKTITRTFTAKDICGNTATSVQIIKILDTKPPVITCPQKLTLECSGANNSQLINNWLGSISATDACGGVMISTNYNSGGFTGGCNSAQTVTFKATDACGNTSTCTASIEIKDNTPPTIADLPDVTIECNQALPTNQPSASDNCGISVQISKIDSEQSGNCAQGKTITRTFKATDACGNTATSVQVITIIDNKPPTINCPQKLTLECSSANNAQAIANWLSSVSASDACGNVTISNNYSAGNFSGGCNSTQTVTFKATDVCGNAATCTAVIEIKDNTPPSIGDLPDVTIECDQALPTAQPGANDNCTNVTVSKSDKEQAGACPQEKIITRTFTATDGCGNTATSVQIITVRDTKRPSLSLNQNFSNHLNALGLTITGNCVEATPGNFVCGTIFVECGLQSLPNITPNNAHEFVNVFDNCDFNVNLTFDTQEQITTCPEKERRVYIYTATDDCGNKTTLRFTVVKRDTKPPLINCPSKLTLECSAANNAQVVSNWLSSVSASDLCGSVTLSNNFSTGNFNGSCNASQIVTFKATDACGNTATCTAVVELKDNQPPTIADLPDVTIECDQPLPTNQPGASDNCSVSVSVSKSDKEQSGVCPQAKTITRTFTATDGCGNTATSVQIITVRDTKRPTLAFNDKFFDYLKSLGLTMNGNCTETSPGNFECGTIYVECGLQNMPNITPSNAHQYVNVWDNCDFSVTLTFEDVEQKASCPEKERFICVYTATDDCGNKTTLKFTVVKRDTKPPVIKCPSKLTLECSGYNNAQTIANWLEKAEASDLCGFVAISNNYNSNNFSGGCNASQVVTFKATDICGNTATCTAVIEIKDNTPPSISDLPDITIECGAPLPSTLPSASDNCGNVNVQKLDAESLGYDCSKLKVITRKFTATDACGNTATSVQIITVRDTKRPTISFNNKFYEHLQSLGLSITGSCQEVSPGVIECGTIYVECGLQSLPNITPNNALQYVWVEDNCSSKVWVGFEDQEFYANCPEKEKFVCVYTAKDDCGNVTKLKFWVVKRDTKKPNISCPSKLTLECSGSNNAQTIANWLAKAEASDLCGSVTINNNYSSNNFSSGCTASQVVTFKATDACGNTATCTAVIELKDNTPPSISDLPDVTIECGAPLPSSLPSASDNCGKVSIEKWDTESLGYDCSKLKVITRKFTATDACGNTATSVQIITVRDTKRPTISFNNKFYDYLQSLGLSMTGSCQEVSPGVIECGTIYVECGLQSLPNITPSNALQYVWVEDNCSSKVWVGFEDQEFYANCPEKEKFVCVYTAKDDCGNVTKLKFWVVKRDTKKPSISCPPKLSLECSNNNSQAIANWLSKAEASDLCGSVTISTNYNSQGFSGGCTASQVVTFKATDACGNTATCTSVIELKDNQPPTISDLPDVTIECGASLPSSLPTAADNCSKVSIEKWDTESLGYDCSKLKVITRKFTATDGCGNTATSVQIITVRDTKRPTIAFNSKFYDYLKSLGLTMTGSCQEVSPGVIECGTIYVECGMQNLPNITGGNAEQYVTVSDNCTANLWVGFSDQELSANCPEKDKFVCTYTAKDDCGNMTTLKFWVVKRDTKPPVINCPSKLSFDCSGSDSYDAIEKWLKSATANDLCGSVTISHNYNGLSGAACGSPKVVTFKATDACGNTATCTSVIELKDTKPPVFTHLPSNVTLNCGDPLPQISQPTASDNCGKAEITYKDSEKTSYDCSKYKVITRTYTATDACGNTATATQTVTYADKKPPVFYNVPPNVTIECDQPLPTSKPSASDACYGKVEVYKEDTEEYWQDNDGNPYNGCQYLKIIKRKFIATDACYNDATIIQTITVRDTKPPVFASDTPQELPCMTLEGFYKWKPKTPVATDKCGPAYVDEPQVITSGTCDKPMLSLMWTARDQCGNTAQFKQWVCIIGNIPTSNLSCDITGPTNVICSSKDQTFTAQVSGGTAPYKYEWKVLTGTWTILSGADTKTITVHAKGGMASFRVTVTDAKGCSTTCTVTRTCTPGDDEFCSLTQGAYGSEGGNNFGKTTLQLIQDALKQDINGDGKADSITLGLPGRSIKFSLAAAQCIIDLLPGGSQGKMLEPGDIIVKTSNGCSIAPNPTNSQGRMENILAAQTLTLALNVRVDPSLFYLPLANTCQVVPSFILLQLPAKPYVGDLLAYANKVLGGAYPAYTNSQFGQVVTAVSAINEKFDECKKACGTIVWGRSLEGPSLNAERGEAGVALDWTTDHADIAAMYEIEHSVDGENFTVIAAIDHTPKTEAFEQLTYTHEQAPVGHNFYRVREWYDGLHPVTVSGVAQVFLPIGAVQATLFPNPAEEEFAVDIIRSEGKSVKVQVIDQLGVTRLTYQSDALPKGKIRLSCADLSAGLYQVRIETADALPVALPLVVQRR